MSLTPAVIDALVAAGATVEMLAAAVKADMAEAEARLSEKRAKDAARQRKCRGSDAVSHDVTVTERDNADITEPPLSRPPNDNNSNPPTHTPEKQTPRARGKHPMPVDWQPGPLTGDAAEAAANWPPGAVERELARFRDWAAGGGPNTRKENWDATWRNWVRRAQDEGRYRGQPQQRQQRDPASTIDAVQRAIELTGGPTGCDPAGSGRSDQRIGQVPDAVRAIGHVER